MNRADGSISFLAEVPDNGLHFVHIPKGNFDLASHEHIGDANGNNTACVQTVARDNLAHGMAKRAVFAKEMSKGAHN